MHHASRKKQSLQKRHRVCPVNMNNFSEFPEIAFNIYLDLKNKADADATIEPDDLQPLLRELYWDNMRTVNEILPSLVEVFERKTRQKHPVSPRKTHRFWAACKQMFTKCFTRRRA